MMRPLVVAGALLLVAAGCGDSDDKKASDSPSLNADPTKTAYVAKVNQLCDDLIDEVVPITGDGEAPEVRKYLANRPKLAPIYEAFDAQVAAVPAETAAEKTAKDAVTAYLAALDSSDADLVAKADDLSGAELEAAFQADLDEFFTSPERQALLATGIQCPAR